MFIFVFAILQLIFYSNCNTIDLVMSLLQNWIKADVKGLLILTPNLVNDFSAN